MDRFRVITLRGQEFKVHPNELLSNAIVRDGDFFEAEILDFIRDNFNKQDTILDIGANIGNHTIYFSRYLEYKRIVAFEPDYNNFVVLVNNIGNTSNIFPQNFALGDQSGYLSLQLNRDNWGAHEINPSLDYNLVNIYPLDYFSLDNITLMKIDVEWYEPKVLLGAKETIEKCKPLILIEDTNKEYGKLLPQYDMIRGWDHHKTYLYKWRD